MAQRRWSLRGSNVVVTGGTKGIGFASCVEMIALGANILFCSRTKADVDLAVEKFNVQIQEAGLASKVAGIVCDVACPEGRETLLQAANSEAVFNGIVDVLVNNVGTNKRAKIEDVTEADYQLMFRTNVDSCFHLTRDFFPILKKSTRVGGARVINISSLAGLFSSGTGSVYAMTKAAMNQLTKNLACEWARTGITVNTVAPWMTMTPLLRKAVENNPGQLKKVEDWTPMGRLADATEIAAAVTFLALPASSYMNGQILAVDGGLSAQGFAGPCASYSS